MCCSSTKGDNMGRGFQKYLGNLKFGFDFFWPRFGSGYRPFLDLVACLNVGPMSEHDVQETFIGFALTV